MADLQLGEAAEEASWRRLVEQGLKGAPWAKLVGKTADGIEIGPLYREPDCPTAGDAVGFPGAAPFVRGARQGAWLIRQAYDHPDPDYVNGEILADLQGGVSAIELIVDPSGEHGVAISSASDLDRALAGVILEAAPVSLDAGGHSPAIAALLADKLKGVAARGTAFNLDPLGTLMSTGGADAHHEEQAVDFTLRHREQLPAARFLRIDARPVHEAGGTEAQEIAVALACGIHYLRALTAKGLSATHSASAFAFALALGPDVLIEAAKLRALRLCWARVLEASGAEPEARGAFIHAFTGKRMMTRHDAETNILRVTTAAFAGAIGGADALTTLPFTDALGLPTSFARRVARNTQLVLMEESHLDHVADPAGGAWFVEHMTRELAALAWTKMQAIEAQGGIVAALQSGAVQREIGEARAARQTAFARRKETITGVTDFPLLGKTPPATLPREYRAQQSAPRPAGAAEPLTAIRWAAPFEALRDRAEGKSKGVFFANLGPLAEFSPRSVFSQNFLAVGGVGAIGAEHAHASRDDLVSAFKASGATVAVITGSDARYADEAEATARALKQTGALWVVLAGKPGEREDALRAAGVDQFIFAGIDVVKALETLHTALGLSV